jgi:hypothetical protein
MGRYRQTGLQVQTPPLVDGDKGWLGVNNRLDPAQLEPGLCSGAINYRFSHGEPESRKGIRKLNWMNPAPQRFIQPYGTIYGTAKFKDPNGVDWDVVAADGQVYLCREGQPPVTLPLPAGITILNPITFTQCFHVMLMFRGPGMPELVMERIEEGFKNITQQPNAVTGATSENPIDGTEAIPNADRGLFFQNRVFIPYGRDLVAASDYLNYTRYSPIRAAFRINQGSSDKLVALGRFNETTLIAFKEQSVYAIGNLTGDLSGATLYEITSEYGLKAARSIVAVGKDLWFLGDKRGICSITLTEQNKIQGLDVPVSQDAQGIIDRINWRYADQAVAAYWQNRFYLALPIDAAEVVKRSLLSAGVVYDGSGSYKLKVIPGRKYRWIKGANDGGVAEIRGITGFYDGAGQRALPNIVTAAKTYRWKPGSSTSLVNGTETLLASGGQQTFTAQSESVTFTGTPLALVVEDLGQVFLTQSGDMTNGVFGMVELFGTAATPITATFQPIFKGVNNAVLIYDFQNQRWSGHDQSEVLQVKDWTMAPAHGRPRLIYFSHDGFMNLYEEGTNDENILAEQPDATELRVIAPPAPGWWFQIQGGTQAAATLSTANAGANWGIGNPANTTLARLNFWGAIAGPGGWRADALTPWSAPEHEVTRITKSTVRFRYLRGDQPSLYATSGADAGIELLQVAQIYREPVVSEFISRGYHFNIVEPKSFLRLLLSLASYHPNYTIDLLLDGAHESVRIVSFRTRDPLKYFRPHDKADFVPSNINGDYMPPYREDYTWLLQPTDGTFLDTKIDPDFFQEIPERLQVSGRGKHARIKITNRQGRIRIKSMALEAILASRRFGVHA